MEAKAPHVSLFQQTVDAIIADGKNPSDVFGGDGKFKGIFSMPKGMPIDESLERAREILNNWIITCGKTESDKVRNFDFSKNLVVNSHIITTNKGKTTITFYCYFPLFNPKSLIEEGKHFQKFLVKNYLEGATIKAGEYFTIDTGDSNGICRFGVLCNKQDCKFHHTCDGPKPRVSFKSKPKGKPKEEEETNEELAIIIAEIENVD